ncbi:MAG: PPC domain-containing protein, partial [Planctomycetes bacterium]|nr:PPC domain-containing protein [Planctomycetota bacterium]
MTRILSTLFSCTLFAVAVSAQGQPETNEPGNDSMTGAESVASNGQCYGQLGAAVADRDFWSFTITGPKRLTAWTSRRGAEITELGGTATSDTILEVYDPNGFFLGFNDDYGGTKYSLASVDLPAAGTYFVAVTTFVDPYVTTFANGDYALDIRCEDPPGSSTYSIAPSEAEPNDDCAAADSTSDGFEHLETLQMAGDRDFFTFTLPYLSRVKIRTWADASTTGTGCADTKLWLYDDACVELASNDNGGTGLHARIVRELDPGTYSVEVSDHLRNALGDYRLTVDIEVLAAQDVLPGSAGCIGTGGQPLMVVPRPGERPRVGSQVTTDIANLPGGPCAILL